MFGWSDRCLSCVVMHVDYMHNDTGQVFEKHVKKLDAGRVV